MSLSHKPKTSQNGTQPKVMDQEELSQKSKKRRKPAQKVELEIVRSPEPSDDSASETEAGEQYTEQVKEENQQHSRTIPVDARELEIEKSLFGASSVFDLGADGDSQRADDFETHPLDEDDEPISHVLGQKADDEAPNGPPRKKKKSSETEAQAAWADEDDEEEKVNVVRNVRNRKLRHSVEEIEVSGSTFQTRLREQRAKLHGNNQPKWANLRDSDDEESGGPSADLLQSSMKLVHNKDINAIEPDRIRIGLMADANREDVSKAVVQVVRWHPNGSLLMTAGFDKTLRLFDIDGVTNAKLQSTNFSDLPLTSATWSPSGNEVYLSGLNHCLYVYEILSGKIDRIDRIMGAKEEKFKTSICSPKDVVAVLGGAGRIHILSQKTKTWITTLKMNGVVNTALFDSSGRLWTAGEKGEVYVWDMETFVCLRRFTDEGSAPIYAMSLSPNEEYFVTGSQSGICNIYRVNDEESFASSAHPKPFKTIYNLTTAITSIAFNHDSQLLAIASDQLRNQLRLIHLPSFRVYQNWPTQETPLGRISALSFSPDSHWLTVGNVRGAVKLFKLHHYHPSSISQ